MEHEDRLLAEIERLEGELRAAQESEAAMEAKVKSLAPHGTCACSYDHPDHVCMHHSPQLQALTAQVEIATKQALETERGLTALKHAMGLSDADTIGDVLKHWHEMKAQVESLKKILEHWIDTMSGAGRAGSIDSSEIERCYDESESALSETSQKESTLPTIKEMSGLCDLGTTEDMER